MHTSWFLTLILALVLPGEQGTESAPTWNPEAWMTGLLTSEEPALAQANLRTLASGVAEELVFRGVSGDPGVPAGFQDAFLGASLWVKLLGTVEGRQHLSIRVGSVTGYEVALFDLLETSQKPSDGDQKTPREFEYTARWTRPLAGRFVDVTRALLAHDAESRLALGLGIDELRERLDPRIGIPLVGHVAGIAAGDLDGDGRADLLLAAPGGVANRVLRAQHDGTALNRAPELGLDVLDATRSVLIADLTGNGQSDVWMTLGDELVGFERDVDGRYEVAVRLPGDATTSMACADVDQDGFLDTYVCGYANPYEGGSVPQPYHDANNGVANVLWRGAGGWSFERATKRLGLDQNNRRFSFAAAFADIDEDGDPDLYVANDFGRNNLYENRGLEGFVDIAGELGVENLAAGMGITFGDLDLDGDEDFYVANMYSAAGQRVSSSAGFRADAENEERAAYRRHASGNAYFEHVKHNGRTAFREHAKDLGIDAAWWSWGARAIDVDCDGALDLAVPAGMITRADPDDL